MIQFSHYFAFKLFGEQIVGQGMFSAYFLYILLVEQSFVCKLQNCLGKIILAKTSNKFNCFSRFPLNSLNELVDKLCTNVKFIPGILQQSRLNNYKFQQFLPNKNTKKCKKEWQTKGLAVQFHNPTPAPHPLLNNLASHEDGLV